MCAMFSKCKATELHLKKRLAHQLLGENHLWQLNVFLKLNDFCLFKKL